MTKAVELSKEVENGIKASRFADQLNRNLGLKKYLRTQQNMLAETPDSVLHYYHQGPSGDPEQDAETLNLVFSEYARWWFAAQHEYNTRVQIIRSSDDVVRGLLPTDTDLDGQYGGARSEVDYVLQLRYERSQISRGPRNIQNFVNVPVGPWPFDKRPDGTRWFSRSLLVYKPSQINEKVCELFSVTPEWGEVATPHFTMTLLDFVIETYGSESGPERTVDCD
jgi:hypothetical protein